MEGRSSGKKKRKNSNLRLKSGKKRLYSAQSKGTNFTKYTDKQDDGNGEEANN